MSKSEKPFSLNSPTDRSLPIALLRAREKVMGPIRVMLLKAGVTEQQWRVLRVLDETGQTDASEIAKRACLLMPSLTRIIQTLCENGYVTRTRDTKDRRRQIINITKAGQTLIKDNMAESRKISNSLEEQFGRQNVAQLLDLLNALDELDR
ncbi:MAG: homoprotocatechuate degradation operon regulator HpaR [Hyphomicrobiales bacterium]|nr:homoprotocatechuate degradation operon regulator HpaR [Hyphomicrobiales bacterium]